MHHGWKLQARNRTFLLFVLPSLILVAFAFYGPFFMNVFYAFTNWNGIRKVPRFIGWENFVEMLSDGDFAASVGFTAAFAVGFIVLCNVLGLALALFLDQKTKVAGGVRAALFVPYILSLVIVGFIWSFLLGPGFASLAQSGWAFFQQDWLGDRNLNFFTVVLVSVWQAMGFYVVIYYAGLQSIPQELLEAAVIDGTGRWSRFRHIVLPLLVPSINSGVFFSLAASIRLYDVVVSLTRGGPGRATASVTFDIYSEAFFNNRYGYGSAKSLVLLVVVAAIAVVQLKLMKSREVEA